MKGFQKTNNKMGGKKGEGQDNGLRGGGGEIWLLRHLKEKDQYNQKATLYLNENGRSC